MGATHILTISSDSGPDSFYRRCCEVGARIQLARRLGREFWSALKTHSYDVKVDESSRLVFRELCSVSAPKLKEHTHERAAALRTIAHGLADQFAMRLNKEIYHFQMSKSDQRYKSVGCRTYHHAKDLSIVPSLHEIRTTNIVMLTDVDYYVDMPELLLAIPRRYLLFSHVPDKPADVYDGTYHYFAPDNTLKTTISGGAEYSHPVWDYGGDHLTSSGWTSWNWLTRCGYFEHVTYSIERKQVGSHRQFILLEPSSHLKIWYNSWNLYQNFVDWIYGSGIYSPDIVHKKLKRMTPVVPGGQFAAIQAVQKSGVTVSIASTSGGRSSTVSLKTYHTLLNIAHKCTQSKYKLTLAQVGDCLCPVRNVLDKDTLEKRKHDRALWYRFLMSTDQVYMQSVYPIEHAVSRYQFGNEYDVDATPSMKGYMCPFAGASPAPDDCRSNSARCIQKRVREVACDKPLTRGALTKAKEFLDRFIPVSGILHPSDVDEVYSKQDKPTQRAIRERADGMDFKHGGTLVPFMKKEKYPSYNDPRNITPLDPVSKLQWSRYMYALTKYAKEHLRGYAFRKPIEICTQVARCCSNAESVLLGDFSRMDGRISPAVRAFEEMIVMRVFHPSCRSEAKRWQKTQIYRDCITTQGIRYNSGTSRLSGSPETSIFNTLLTAFILFVSYRNKGHDADHAYNMLNYCIFGGDDSLAANLDEKSFVRASAMMGQKVTADVLFHGDPGVEFFSRWYSPYVWNGDPSSCAKIKRAAEGFHVCVHFTTALGKLSEKCTSTIITDRLTPIIGDISRRFFELNGAWADKVTQDMSYWSQYEAKEERYVQTLSGDVDWMMDRLELEFPEFDYSRFIEALEGCKSVEDLLALPQCVDDLDHSAKSGQLYVDGVRCQDPDTATKIKTDQKHGRKEANRDVEAKDRRSKPTSKCVGSASLKPRRKRRRRGKRGSSSPKLGQAIGKPGRRKGAASHAVSPSD